MKLLLNGCSYAHLFKPDRLDLLAKNLNLYSGINLGVPGSCNTRIFRSTTEYLSKNKDVGMIIIFLSFYHRGEGSWAEKMDPYDHNWISYSGNGLNRADLLDTKFYSIDSIEKFVQDRYRYMGKFEEQQRLLFELVWFKKWLDSTNIPYILLNTCDSFAGLVEPYGSIVDAHLSEFYNDRRIFDLKKFMLNQWFFDNGFRGSDQEINDFKSRGIEPSPIWIHYQNDAFDYFSEFLTNYIKEHKILE